MTITLLQYCYDHNFILLKLSKNLSSKQRKNTMRVLEFDKINMIKYKSPPWLFPESIIKMRCYKRNQLCYNLQEHSFTQGNSLSHSQFSQWERQTLLYITLWDLPRIRCHIGSVLWSDHVALPLLLQGLDLHKTTPDVQLLPAWFKLSSRPKPVFQTIMDWTRNPFTSQFYQKYRWD